MTALSESFCLMSIHNVLSWPISTLLLFSQIGKSVLDTAAYSCASKLEGLNCLQLWISLPEVTGHFTTTSETKVNMSTIHKDYHDFADIFSKSKASKLADH